MKCVLRVYGDRILGSLCLVPLGGAHLPLPFADFALFPSSVRNHRQEHSEVRSAGRPRANLGVALGDLDPDLQLDWRQTVAFRVILWWLQSILFMEVRSLDAWFEEGKGAGPRGFQLPTQLFRPAQEGAAAQMAERRAGCRRGRGHTARESASPSRRSSPPARPPCPAPQH